MQLDKILAQTITVVQKVGAFIKDEQSLLKNKDIETKGLHNYVTYVDKTAEMFIIEDLKKILPNSGFLAEEGTTMITNNNEYVWIIDPLDGTTNYIHGLMPVAISIALQKKNKTILGVVYELAHNECFYAIENEPAYCNGKEIKVSETCKVNNSLIATGFPYYDYQYLSEYMKTLEYFMKHSHGLRRLGSAATDLAYVACGRFDAFYEYGLSPWDVAAGAFIVERAGGKVGDFNGKENFIYGKEIIASNNLIFNELLETIKKIMPIITDELQYE